MGLCQLGSYTASIAFTTTLILTILVPALKMSGFDVSSMMPTIALSEMYSSLVRYALQPVPVSSTTIQFAQLATFVTLSITLTTLGFYLSLWYLLVLIAGPIAVITLPIFGILTISTGWYILSVLTRGRIPCT